MHIHIYIFTFIYIYNHLGTQKPVFFPSFGADTFFSVIAGLLVRLKARSGEPKYGLLTRVKSKRNFGFLLGFYQYCSVFFWRIVGLSAPLGQLWPKVNQIDMFFPSNATYFQSR